ncbi:AzlC family ABC transporter permease [Marispirochaeta sp.]|uniref:AzlC family ABC transporter permease n=1 Tax=Marispirochaeta sp. TaxID=2038653 RepID=UPI0029C7ADB6|nr:AzlC family ABC transporter permease [Marispirochaeta sp.]
MSGQSNTKNQVIRVGIAAGIPIFIGYFPAAVAFGLLARNGGLDFTAALLFSVTNFAGASQFLALNLTLSGAALYEIVAGVLLVNLRYLLMSASLRPKLRCSRLLRGIAAFGNTDEVFAVAAMREGYLEPRFIAGLEGISYTGWVSGTVTGYLFGSILPEPVQAAVGGTLYALFAALLVPEVKRESRNLLVACLAAAVNSILVFGAGVSIGWSFVAALLIAALFGALYIPAVPEYQEAL